MGTNRNTISYAVAAICNHFGARVEIKFSPKTNFDCVCLEHNLILGDSNTPDIVRGKFQSSVL
jgi:hypothetical protein